MAVVLVGIAGLTATSSADAYVKSPPVYDEHGNIADEAEDWLRDFGTDVEAEMNTAASGSGTETALKIGKYAKFGARVSGWAGVAIGAYEICDAFFQKGCWLFEGEEQAQPTLDGGGGWPSINAYGPCEVGEYDPVSGDTSCGLNHVSGDYSAHSGENVYITQMAVFRQVPGNGSCNSYAFPPQSGWTGWRDASPAGTITWGTCPDDGTTMYRGVLAAPATQTTITPPNPTLPNNPAVPDIDTVEQPLPATFLPDLGDDLAEDDSEDTRREIERRLPVPVPAIHPGETAEAYRARLVELGLLGRLVALTDATLDPAYGPLEAVRTNPAVGTKVARGTQIDVIYNPESAPPVDGGGPGSGGGGGDGTSSCDHPPIRDFDLGPLMVSPGDKFPFGVFIWINGALGGLVAGGEAPRISLPMPGEIDDLVIDFDRFSSLMDWIHPALLFLSFISLAWLLANAVVGLGRPTEE